MPGWVIDIESEYALVGSEMFRSMAIVLIEVHVWLGDYMHRAIPYYITMST